MGVGLSACRPVGAVANINYLNNIIFSVNLYFISVKFFFILFCFVVKLVNNWAYLLFSGGTLLYYFGIEVLFYC